MSVERKGSTISRHIRSNVVGYIAIFMFALGGSAYATHPGGEKTISSVDIIDDEVFSEDVANDTLAGGGLAAADLRPDSVGTSEVAPNSIGTGEVAAESLNSLDIAADSIGSSELGFNSVGTNEVAADSLTSFDLGPDSIGSSELGFNSVGTGEVAFDSLTSADIAADSIGSSELGSNSVGSNEVAADSLNGFDIFEAGLTGFDPEAVSARKYASVTGTVGTTGVTVDESASKGIADANVKRAATGIYCFGLGYTPDTVIGSASLATVAPNLGHTDRVLTGRRGTADGCPAGTNAVAYLRDITQAELVNGAFFVQFESK